MNNISRFLFVVFLMFITSNSLHAQWNHSYGIYGGEVNCLTSKDNIIYAGTYNGVFVSTDNGANWTQINNGLSSNPVVLDLVFLGENIYAAIFDDGGVYRSTNNGANWTAVNNGLPRSNNRILVQSLAVSGNNVYAGMNSTAGGGVYLSTDNGNSWTARNNGLPSGMNVYGFAVKGNNIFVGGWGGVYSSTNNGTNWTAVNNGLPNLYTSCLATDGSNIFTYVSNAGVYMSADNGANWVFRGLSSAMCITISNNKIYSGDFDAVFLSTDSGSTWTMINKGRTSFNNDVYVIDIEVIGNNIFLATTGGIYLSTDNGINWSTVNNGLTCVSISAIAISGNNIFVGTNYQGLYVSNDNGLIWRNFNNDNGWSDITALLINGNSIFAGTWNGFVYLSTNNGETWAISDDRLGTVSSFIVKENNIYCGVDGGVYLSTNNGKNWTAVNDGLDNDLVTALVVKGDNIFASAYSGNGNGPGTGGVFISTNNGTNWTAVNSGLNNYGVSSLTTDGNNIYAGTGWVGVYLSTNNGTTWTLANDGLGTKSVNALTAYGSNIFAGTDQGLYLSTNNGNKWTQVNGGLSNTNINTLTINGNHIYAGTNGGLNSAIISDITFVEIKTNSLSEFNLYQNYPNPFNPSTSISFSLPTRSFVSLKIFDLVGREVSTIVSEELSAGNYSRQWNAATMSSGIYFYRLQAGSFIETKKLVLLR